MIRRKKARKPNPLKVSTRSAVRKGPARDSEHLDRVRESGCVVCVNFRLAPFMAQAHHVRSLRGRSMGRRVSDHLTIGLCRHHHDELHSMNEGRFWQMIGIDPGEWIARFSPEGAAEIERINGAAANK